MKRYLLPALRLIVTGVTIVIVIRLLLSVDMAQVWAAIQSLALVEMVVLLSLLLLVRTLNAVPMAVFVPGLSVRRSLVSDLAACLVATVAPPPGDMFIRFAMFDSWGISRLAGTVGLTLNTLSFYVVKCSAPVLGLTLLLATGQFGGGPLWITAVCAILAGTLVALIVAAVHAERLAANIGRSGGRLAHRFRADAVDPEEWATRMVEFRARVGDRLRTGWPRVGLAGVGMLMAEGYLLVYSLRSVDLPASSIGPLTVIGGYLIAYPLTALPFSGIGVLDGFMFAFIVARVGTSYETAVTAGLVVWRVTTLLVTYALGAGAVLGWRHRHPRVADTGSELTPDP